MFAYFVTERLSASRRTASLERGLLTQHRDRKNRAETRTCAGGVNPVVRAVGVPVDKGP